MNTTNYIYKEECYAIRGAVMDVHNELGWGFAEDIYQEALEIEFRARGIPFERQKRIAVKYKGNKLSKLFVPDLVCYGKIIVELKVVKSIADAHRAQLRYYLRATQFKLGLLVNFGSFPHAEIKPSINDFNTIFEGTEL